MVQKYNKAENNMELLEIIRNYNKEIDEILTAYQQYKQKQQRNRRIENCFIQNIFNQIMTLCENLYELDDFGWTFKYKDFEKNDNYQEIPHLLDERIEYFLEDAHIKIDEKDYDMNSSVELLDFLTNHDSFLYALDECREADYDCENHDKYINAYDWEEYTKLFN